MKAQDLNVLERRRLQGRKWYAANAEKKKEYGRNYYALHREAKIVQAKEYRTKNPHVTLKSRLKCQYGISIETMNEMLKAQSGGCAICSVVLDSSIKNLVPHVDHDHVTGMVRGLLCSKCNLMLGWLERPKIFAATKKYLGAE